MTYCESFALFPLLDVLLLLLLLLLLILLQVLLVLLILLLAIWVLLLRLLLLLRRLLLLLLSLWCRIIVLALWLNHTILNWIVPSHLLLILHHALLLVVLVHHTPSWLLEGHRDAWLNRSSLHFHLPDLLLYISHLPVDSSRWLLVHVAWHHLHGHRVWNELDERLDILQWLHLGWLCHDLHRSLEGYAKRKIKG